MVVRVLTSSLQGLDAQLITVEIDLANGLPDWRIVGLPDAMVNESKDRLRSAIRNAGFEFPAKKMIMNLAPASVRKEGTGFDVPIALSVLLAGEKITQPHPHWLEKTLWLGEVSLEGDLRPIRGVLSVVILAKQLGFEAVVVPPENATEAALLEGVKVFSLKNLAQLPTLFKHPELFKVAQNVGQLLADAQATLKKSTLVDFADVKGQTQAKRALEIAAAGGHNVLMAGPPGSGKSLLSKAFAGILPPLDLDETLEVSRIYSVAGMLSKELGIIAERPFRSPHHSASMAGLCGGGSYPKPGEITLSHRGVLFLDELVEFPRPVLEILRQPLEEGVVTISRANANHTFPARFILIGALNPCPCGYRGDSTKACSCSPNQVERYMNKLSGPLLDRIDLHLEVPRLSSQELLQQTVATGVDSSETVRARVVAARAIQQARFQAEGLCLKTNAELAPAQLRAFCELSQPCQTIMSRALERLNLSARGYDRVLRVARTIADLANSPTIDVPHLTEALQYRSAFRGI